MDHFPNNNASHYYTKLPQSIDLKSGDYEVGLAEIMFNNSYLNIRDKECWIKFRTNEQGEHHLKMLAAGLYDSAEYVIQSLNNLIKTLPDRSQHGKIKFHFDRASKKATIKIYQKGGGIILSPALQELLGMESQTLWGPDRFESKGMIDIHRDFYAVYVYCDLVEQRPVGDAMVPLLRIVPISEKKADVVHHIFEKPQYIPLIRHQFNTLEILLTTDTGKPISFVKGKTVVTLHFRRRRPEHF